MKPLLCCPIINNRTVTQQFLDSIVHQRNDIILLINGDSDSEIAPLIKEYEAHPTIKLIIWEEENIYVNPAWNKFMNIFLNSPEYSHLLILNSDLILHHDFFRVLKWGMTKTIPLPLQVDKDQVKVPVLLNGMYEAQYINGGYPGICMVLPREVVQACYPIPEQIKVFYGDDWIFHICKSMGYKTAIIDKLQVFHEGSQAVNAVPGIMEVIEQDHIAWETIKPMLEQRWKS